MPRTRLPMSLMLAALVALSSPVALLPGVALAQDDFADAGLVSETEYISPQHGYEITWDAAWGIEPGRISPVLWDNLVSDKRPDIPVYTRDFAELDRIDLWLEGTGARLRIAGVTSANDWLDANLLASTVGAGGGFAVTTLTIDDPEEIVVVHRHSMNDGSVYLAYNQLVPGTDPDYLVLLQLIAPEDEFVDAFARATSDIESDAFDLGGAVTAQDILDANANVPFTPDSDFGITSATRWVSPAFGTGVEWTGDFTTYRNLAGTTGTSSNALALGPLVDATWLIEVEVTPNNGGATLESLLQAEVETREQDEEEVAIASVEGDRAIMLCRDIFSGSAEVSYVEYGLSADGASIVRVEMASNTSDDEFTTHFTIAAGAVVVDGIPFAGIIDPAIIIAAANAPIDEE
jgi:hypothetical protein